MPTLSFVVTLYNRVTWLPYVLAGIAADEMAASSEVILLDDGSTDGSAELAEELTRGWPAVRVLRQANQGPSSAWAAAVAAARGEWVRPLDCDDMPLPWGSALLLDAVRGTGAGFAFAPPELQPGYAPVPGGPAALPEVPRPADARPVLLDLLPLSLRRAQSQPSVWLARRDWLAEAGDRRVFVQDYAVELRLAARGPAARLDAPVTRIGRHPGQLGGNQAQVLHDVNAALLRFVEERLELAPALRRFAWRRAAGRAWAWAGRHGAAAELPRVGWARCRALLGLRPDPAALLAPFRRSGRIRLP